MALNNKQKRQIGDVIVNDIHCFMEFYSERLKSKYQLQDLSEEDEVEVNDFLIKIIKKIPNNIYKK